MGPTRELIDELFRERVLRARRIPLERKFLSGAELYEGACRRMMDGLRMENPEADEASIRELLRRRLARLRLIRGEAP
jgi:hypothetical protein